MLSSPIDLPGMPFEYNSESPTPLDPYGLTIHGIAAYPSAALEYMSGQLHLAVEGVDVPDHYIRKSEQEIHTQHAHRMNKNDESLQRWKESAKKADTLISREVAEGIMQIRAGISRVYPAVSLLSKVPEMEAIEIFKATRPYCIQHFLGAKAMLYKSLKDIEKRPDTHASFDFDAAPSKDPLFDRELATVITKTKLGEIVLNGVVMEVMSRESAQMFEASATPENMESWPLKSVPFEINATPINVTSYIRVKRSID